MTRRTLVGFSFALFALAVSLVASPHTAAMTLVIPQHSAANQPVGGERVVEASYLGEITNFRAGRDALYFVNATLDGPCLYGQSLPAASACGRTEVYVVSFDTAEASSPVITLGTGKPNGDGVFAPGAITTTLLLPGGNMTHHEIILYPNDPDFKRFESRPTGYNGGGWNYWDNVSVVIRSYDRSAPTAPAAIHNGSGYVQYDGSGFIQD